MTLWIAVILRSASCLTMPFSFSKITVNHHLRFIDSLDVLCQNNLGWAKPWPNWKFHNAFFLVKNYSIESLSEQILQLYF